MQQAKNATDKVKIIIFYDMFKVQNTLAILTASAAMLIMACDGTATSEEILLPQEAEISSSSIDSTASSSSIDSAAGKSSQGSKVSSSSQATSSPASSSQASSSSVESSSQASSSDSYDLITRMGKLPFDTTGVIPEVLHYTYLLDEFESITDPEQKERYLNSYRQQFGDSLQYYILVTEGDGHYCRIGTGIAGGQGDYQNAYIAEIPSDCILIVHEDALLFTNVSNCTSLSWDACYHHGTEYAYTNKIIVGNDTFYYGEFQKIFLLIQVTDSTITNWSIKNPSYEPPAAKKFAWNKSYFENDTLVKFISDDTIFIEKYNLKITANEDTWIFGDEVCSTLGYKKAPGMTDEESCEALETYHNEAIKCRQKNLNITNPNLFPSLCRPDKSKKSFVNIWCILDEELENKLKYAI